MSSVTGKSGVHPPEVYTETELRRVLAKIQALTPPDLETLLTGPEYFGLTTATSLQRAACRALDGLPLNELANDPTVLAAFGGVLPSGKPVELDILSGIRAGKSLLVAALAVHWTQTCDISKLGPGEVARVSVISLKVDLANVVFSHIVGNVQASPRLRALLVGQPSVDTVTLRHPSGRPVEIKVVAGTRAGASLVARWSAGAIFDEFTRMVGSEDGVVNYEDSRAAVLGRLLPGAQIASIGSPWASTGPAYSRYIQYWGKANAAIVIIKAPGWAMNPTFWTPDRCAKLKADAPDVYRTDCAAEFSSPEDAFFTADEVRRATRDGIGDLPYWPGCEYAAAMDPATRGNAWTLVVVGKVAGKFKVASVRQWQGSREEPLDPAGVLGEIAEHVHAYGLLTISSDQVMGDALRTLATQAKLYIRPVQQTPNKRLAAYTGLKHMLAGGLVELHPDKYLREDLLRVRKRVTAGGAIVVLPETQDGRHCDYAPALTLALARWMHDPKAPEDKSEQARLAKELRRSKRALEQRYRKR